MMRVSPVIRILLMLTAAGIAICASIQTAFLCFIPIVILYIVVGERKLLFGYIRPLSILLFASSGLWFAIYLDPHTLDARYAFTRLVETDSPLRLMVRMVSASALAVLAIGSAPDGTILAVTKSIGFNADLAAVFASSLSLIRTIPDSYERSITALEAHGVITNGRFSRLRHLPIILGLTWTSCLDLVMSRAAIKWRGNGFLVSGSPAFSVQFVFDRYHEVYCTAAIAIIILILGWA